MNTKSWRRTSLGLLYLYSTIIFCSQTRSAPSTTTETPYATTECQVLTEITQQMPNGGCRRVLPLHYQKDCLDSCIAEQNCTGVIAVYTLGFEYCTWCMSGVDDVNNRDSSIIGRYYLFIINRRCTVSEITTTGVTKSRQTAESCHTPIWIPTKNKSPLLPFTNYYDVTLSECQTICLSNPSCYGVDYVADSTMNMRNGCFVYEDAQGTSGTDVLPYAVAATWYMLSSVECTTTILPTTVETTTEITTAIETSYATTECQIWILIPNRVPKSGCLRTLPLHNIQDCLDTCVAQKNCIGVVVWYNIDMSFSYCSWCMYGTDDVNNGNPVSQKNTYVLNRQCIISGISTVMIFPTQKSAESCRTNNWETTNNVSPLSAFAQFYSTPLLSVCQNSCISNPNCVGIVYAASMFFGTGCFLYEDSQEGITTASMDPVFGIIWYSLNRTSVECTTTCTELSTVPDTTTVEPTTFPETTTFETSTIAATTFAKTATAIETTFFADTTIFETTSKKTTFETSTIATTNLAKTTTAIETTSFADTTIFKTTFEKTTSIFTTIGDTTSISYTTNFETTLPETTTMFKTKRMTTIIAETSTMPSTTKFETSVATISESKISVTVTYMKSSYSRTATFQETTQMFEQTSSVKITNVITTSNLKTTKIVTAFETTKTNTDKNDEKSTTEKIISVKSSSLHDKTTSEISAIPEANHITNVTVSKTTDFETTSIHSTTSLEYTSAAEVRYFVSTRISVEASSPTSETTFSKSIFVDAETTGIRSAFVSVSTTIIPISSASSSKFSSIMNSIQYTESVRTQGISTTSSISESTTISTNSNGTLSLRDIILLAVGISSGIVLLVSSLCCCLRYCYVPPSMPPRNPLPLVVNAYYQPEPERSRGPRNARRFGRRPARSRSRIRMPVSRYYPRYRFGV